MGIQFLCVVTAIAATLHTLFIRAIAIWAVARPGRDFADDFHITTFVLLGLSLLIGAYIFSHNKNTALLQVPFWGHGQLR